MRYPRSIGGRDVSPLPPPSAASSSSSSWWKISVFLHTAITVVDSARSRPPQLPFLSSVRGCALCECTVRRLARLVESANEETGEATLAARSTTTSCWLNKTTRRRGSSFQTERRRAKQHSERIARARARLLLFSSVIPPASGGHGEKGKNRASAIKKKKAACFQQLPASSNAVIH